jgi:hypothetical protein
MDKRIAIALAIIFAIVAAYCGTLLHKDKAANLKAEITDSTKNAIAQEAPTQSAPQEWNKEDVDATTNGNILLAVRLLGQQTAAETRQKAVKQAPALVIKAPWKYYGQIIKFSGAVGIATDYPPGSDVSSMFNGDECGEIVMYSTDGTIVDYMHSGSTGNISEGGNVVVYGYPVGRAEVPNKLGGTSEQLIVVGKAIVKQ